MLLLTKTTKELLNKIMSWDKEQEQYLVDNYGQLSTAEIAKELRKTTTNIYSKAGRLGLKYITPSERERKQREQERKAKMDDTKELIDNTLSRLGLGKKYNKSYI